MIWCEAAVWRSDIKDFRVTFTDKTQTQYLTKTLEITVINSGDHISRQNNQDYDLTGAEDAELLSGWNEVEVCGEEVHERTGIHHEHKHAEAVHSHLLPARSRKTWQEVKDVRERDIKNLFSQWASYCWGPEWTHRVWFVFHNRVMQEVKVN